MAVDTTTEFIQVRGARTHCLKNIDLDIPRNQFVVITGKSGSGKSSLAYDTIFAEGQRQYFESLSTYSRQFFSQLPQADVDEIQGLPPTVCLDQQSGTGNPRSTVGTVTEIYDFLRVLMSRAGQVHCYQCDEPIRQQSATEIRNALSGLPETTRMMILAPIVDSRVGAHEDALKKIRRERLVRVRIDGKVYDIEEVPVLEPNQPHSIDAVIDRVIIRPGMEERLQKAVDVAATMSEGNVIASYVTPEQQEESPTAKTDLSQWQERLYSTRYACTKCDIHYSEVEPRSFSFNSPHGACTDCTGLGVQLSFDPNLIVDRTKSLSTGAVLIWENFTASSLKQSRKELQPILKQLGADADQPLDSLSEESWNTFLRSRDKAAPGLLSLVEKEYSTTENDERYDELASLEQDLPCESCQGSRVNPKANSVFFSGKNVQQIVDMPIDQVTQFFENVLDDLNQFDEIGQAVVTPLLTEILKRLNFLLNVGVNYLTLGRGADTLSGGEFQRVRLGSSIGSGLTNVCYILDEPSIGLHSVDNQRLIDSLRDLQANGNSLIVVEHDDAMIRQSDHVIDMGPGVGQAGGSIVAQGSPASLSKDVDSLTAQYLNGEIEIPVPATRRELDLHHSVKIFGASGFNLKSIDVEIPLGGFVCITGVSGSGKSTLINRTLAPALRHRLGLMANYPALHDSIEGLEKVDSFVFIDQRPIGRSSKSCPATFSGVFDEFRKCFAATRTAKQRGYGIGRFSFNSSSGRCGACKGHGTKRIKMNFMPDLFVECEMCRGRRFNVQTLQARFGELSIADALELSIDEALDRFDGFSRIKQKLETMSSVGLGYLKLGQSATTLSGGEAQRLKLARELSRTTEGHALYVLDEPTTGLHFQDVKELLAVLHRIASNGNSVFVIEHHLDVIKTADWVIDLGPGGGVQGGEVVATGTPEHVANVEGSLTGQFLKPLLSR